MSGMRARAARQGQSTLEMCLALAVIIAALVGMFVILRGAIAGRWRGAADTFGHGLQYEAGVTTVVQ